MIQEQILWSEYVNFTFLFLALRVSNSFKRNAVSVFPPKSAASSHDDIKSGSILLVFLSMVLCLVGKKKRKIMQNQFLPCPPKQNTQK